MDPEIKKKGGEKFEVNILEKKSCLFTLQTFTRNTLTQTSKNGRKPYLFSQKIFVSVFYAINIFNTIYYFKPTNFICA